MSPGWRPPAADEPARRPSVFRRVMFWVLVVFNLAAAVVLGFALWDLRTGMDPGAAIAVALVLVYWIAGDVVLATIALIGFLVRRGRRRA